MASCDPDGAMAQVVGDLMACLVMAMNESMIEATAALADLTEEGGA